MGHKNRTNGNEYMENSGWMEAVVRTAAAPGGEGLTMHDDGSFRHCHAKKRAEIPKQNPFFSNFASAAN